MNWMKPTCLRFRLRLNALGLRIWAQTSRQFAQSPVPDSMIDTAAVGEGTPTATNEQHRLATQARANQVRVTRELQEAEEAEETCLRGCARGVVAVAERRDGQTPARKQYQTHTARQRHQPRQRYNTHADNHTGTDMDMDMGAKLPPPQAQAQVQAETQTWTPKEGVNNLRECVSDRCWQRRISINLLLCLPTCVL